MLSCRVNSLYNPDCYSSWMGCVMWQQHIYCILIKIKINYKGIFMTMVIEQLHVLWSLRL